MNTFSATIKMAATTVVSLVALAAPPHAASEHQAIAPDPNVAVRVVELGRVPGFWAVYCPITVANTAAWTQGDSAEETALQSEGFAGGVRELLRSKSGSTGVSVALRFHSAAGANADVKRREHDAGHHGYATNFALSGSPSVHAYTVRTSGSATVRVAFTLGADEYAVTVTTAQSKDVGALQRAIATAVAPVTAGR